MRIRLKGINSKRKRLADGSCRTYYWAWKGGPPLRGEPGTPEFIASYNEAVAQQDAASRQAALACCELIRRATISSVSRHARARLRRQDQIIEKDFGDFPLSAMTDKRTRGIFKAWRERSRVPHVAKPTTRGWCSHAFCPLEWTAASSPPTPVRAAAGCIVGHERRRFGPPPMRPHFSNVHPRICTCRSCWHLDRAAPR